MHEVQLREAEAKLSALVEAAVHGEHASPLRRTDSPLPLKIRAYSTVTLLARLRGWSTSVPRWTAT